MKILQKNFLKLFGLFFILSCSLYVEGQLNVFSSIELYKKRFFGGREKVRVNPGVYDANVDFNGSRNKVELEIELSPGDSESFDFKTEDTTIPVDGTWVRVESEELEQDYDALISILKTVDRGHELHRDWESCQYERCYTRCSGSGQNRECWRECRNEWGHQLVEYYIVSTKWDTRFQLLAENDVLKAEFFGDKEELHKDYVYQGMCH